VASDYPDALDPAFAALRDDVDTFRVNGLQHIADMAVAVQTILGAGLGDMTSDPGYGGAKKFGNLSQAMQALFRWETGTIDETYDPADLEEVNTSPIVTVNFDTVRFTQPPFVMVQTIEAHQDTGTAGMGAGSPSANGYRESRLFPVGITRFKFDLAASSKTINTALLTSGGIPIKAYWLAIEPVFGFAEQGETDKG
jgi:hypothetical protein